MLVLIAVVLITVFVSAQCSLYEATLYSARMGALESEKRSGWRGRMARKMLAMKRDIAAPIAAILILNTLANTAGATLAGMYADRVLGAKLVPAFSVGLTLTILFFSELIPKTVGAIYWRSVWPVIVWPLTAMRLVLYPVIFLTQKTTDLLTRGKKGKLITEEEILGVIRLGAKHGEISKWEGTMLNNIIQLENTPARHVMTPRTVLFALPESTPVGEAMRRTGEAGFTRVPLYRDDRENIVGYVMIHDLISPAGQADLQAPVSGLAKPIAHVHERDDCLSLLTGFLKQHRHIAVVEDEYGGVAGLLTLEDLLESVIGAEIVDEQDVVADLQKLARDRRRRRDAPPAKEN